MGSKRWSNASTTPDRSTGVPIGLRSSQTCSDRAELRDGPALAEVVLANEEHDRAHGLEGVLQHDPLQVSVVGTPPVLGRKVTLPLRLFRSGERSAMTPGKAAIEAIGDYAQERGLRSPPSRDPSRARTSWRGRHRVPQPRRWLRRARAGFRWRTVPLAREGSSSPRPSSSSAGWSRLGSGRLDVRRRVASLARVFQNDPRTRHAVDDVVHMCADSTAKSACAGSWCGCPFGSRY